MKTICCDLGHGGHDSGATNKGILEKDLNLQIGKKLNNKLTEAGYETVITRDDDYYVKLFKRAQIANRVLTDIFISIHCNACNNPAVQGTEVLHYPNSKNGIKLARFVYDELIDRLDRAHRGLKPRDDLVVLNSTLMPAILVEVAFLSNPTEYNLLQDEGFQILTVEAIFNGIEKYFKDV